MCIIAICERRALTKKEFDACWENNSHGMGYAHWTGNRIESAKGFMKKDEAWKVYRYVRLPHVVHFRIRSAGEVTKALTHPFLITPDSEEFTGNCPDNATPLLFHNGTVSDWKSLLSSAMMHTKQFPGGEMSDSRAMAIAVSVAGEQLLNLFTYMKWVVVDKGGYRKYGDWAEGEDGLLFSNGSFKKHERVAYVHDEWPQNFNRIPQQTFLPVFGTSYKSGTTPGKKCRDCDYVDERNEMGWCGLHDKKLKDDIACSDYYNADEADRKEGQNDSNIIPSCLDCAKFEGARNEQIHCKIYGKMKNLGKCLAHFTRK